MAGHSKWANIKHRKAAQDKKRGKVFTKIIHELTVAAREGGGVPEDNPRLRLVMDKAMAANMTKDTMQRAIDRGAGGGDGDNMEEVVYEGYAPFGVAVLVETLTDNRNRTVAEVRHAFTKNNGNLGTDGSVSYLFSKKGQITFSPGVDEEQVMEIGLEAGAEDVISNDDESIDVTTLPEDFLAVQAAFKSAGLEPDNAEIALVAATEVELDVENGEKVYRLIEMLEDLDDVQDVYSNASFPDEVLG
jgi:YebC/PmpR family DNA-binding regulatory protein